MNLKNCIFKIGNPILTPLYRRLQKDKVIILMYHRILKIEDNFPFDEDLISATPEEFEAQIRYLKKEYQVVDFEELSTFLNQREDRQEVKVIITFDDGYLDNYLYAFPILKKYEVPAMIFLTTDFIEGKRNILWWDELAYLIKNTRKKYIQIEGLGSFPLHNLRLRKKAIENIREVLKKFLDEEKNKILERLRNICEVTLDIKPMFISWEHVKEMSENNISFGAHTCSHIIVTKVPLAKAEEEIVRSRKIIQDKIGKEVKVFSYPNGMEEDYNQEIIKILQRNKFSYATLAMDGINRLGEIIENPYTLRRVGMRSYDNLDYFKLQLSGALVSFRRIRNALWGESPS